MKTKLSCLFLILILLTIGCKDKPNTATTRNKRTETTTPLHAVVDNGSIEQAQSLIAGGANINAKDEYGQTPLHKTIGARGLENRTLLAELLLAHGANSNAKDELGNTPLYKTVKWSSVGVAEVLISTGADLNAKNKDGCIPLHEAAKGLDEGCKDLAELLIANGADINARDKNGATPLHIATADSQKYFLT